MTVGAPNPASPLVGRCSTVYDGTVYVFSGDSFQSLDLAEDAEWKTLSTGVEVDNTACLTTPDTTNSSAALYVIGGNSSSADYEGIQRYTFSTAAWETLTPPTSDLKSRTNHSVAFLDTSEQILIYAGSQDDDPPTLSSQTFVIDTEASTMQAFTSAAPPGNQPILLGFGDRGAVLVGQATRDTEIWTFTYDDGWAQFNTSLLEGRASGVRGAIVSGSDGSQVLATYDMSVSPNVVDQVVLIDSDGLPAASGEVPGVNATGTTSRFVKRALTLATWPAYNDSLSPDIVRTDYAVAVDTTSGMAVISGGSDESSVELFDNDSNSWIDDGTFFTGTADDNVATPATTSSSTSSSTSSNTALPTATSTSSSVTAASTTSSDVSKAKTLRIIGITLGVLSGIAAVFIIALLLLRYRRQQRRKKERAMQEKGNRMSFQDRGASFMKEAGQSRRSNPAPPPTSRFTQLNTSNSFAFFGGKADKMKPRSFMPQRNSSESTRVLKNDIRGPMQLNRWGPSEKEAYNDMFEAPLTGPPQIPASTLNNDFGDNQRASGWSRYLAANQPTPNEYPTRSGYTVANGNYTPRAPSQAPSQLASSAVVPATEMAGNGTTPGQRTRAARRRGSDASSSSTDYSDFDGSDYFGARRASGSISSAWSPMSESHERKLQTSGRTPEMNGGEFASRAVSSNYSASVYGNNQSRLFSSSMSALGMSEDAQGPRESVQTTFPRSPFDVAVPAALSIPKPAARKDGLLGAQYGSQARPESSMTTMTSFLNPGSKPAAANQAAQGPQKTNVKPAQIAIPPPVPIELVLSPGADRQTMAGGPTATMKNAQNAKTMPPAARSKAIVSMGPNMLDAPDQDDVPAVPMLKNAQHAKIMPAAARAQAVMSMGPNALLDLPEQEDIPAMPGAPGATMKNAQNAKTMPAAARAQAVISMGPNALGNASELPASTLRNAQNAKTMAPATRAQAVVSMGPNALFNQDNNQGQDDERATNRDTSLTTMTNFLNGNNPPATKIPGPATRTNVPPAKTMPAAARSNAVVSMGAGSLLNPFNVIDEYAAPTPLPTGRNININEETARKMARPETMMTEFPFGEEQPRSNKKEERQDMSWLNLGLK